MKELKEYFKYKKVDSVLDVGCGGGDFIQVLSSVFSDQIKLTGIDPFEEPIMEAKARFQTESNIEFLQMEGEQMSFPDNNFDVVAISFALHHLDDAGKTLQEMKRVVKPGGWLIINEIISETENGAQENQKMLHHLKGFVDRLGGISHRETYSSEEVKEIVKSNGIKILDSFFNLKMKEPKFDQETIEERYKMMENLIKQLEGNPAYSGNKQMLDTYKDRLTKYGFQIAPSLVVVGQG